MPDPQTVQVINPNIHVLIIHFPIALLFIGTLIELLAFMWRRSGFRAAGRWMILIGALFTIPAATTGMWAARQAMGSSDLRWNDLKPITRLNAAQWEHLEHHVKFNASAALILAVLVVAWIGASDRIRAKLHLVYLLVLLVAVGLITCGAWQGGELVYAQGTGTKLVKGGWPKQERSAEAENPAHSPESAPPDKAKWLFDALQASGDQLTKFDNPVDIHLKLAGWVVALSIVTLGLSLRGLWLNPNLTTADEEVLSRDDDIVSALAGAGERRTIQENRALLAAELRAADRAHLPQRVPAGRFWLLVAVVGIVTALVGWMLVGPDSFKSALEILKSHPRDMAHSISGVSIVVLTLLLALITRFAPYNRMMIGVFSLLLVIALGVQVWLGTLLLFDTNEGSPLKVNPPTTQSSMT